MKIADWFSPGKFQKSESTYKFSPSAKIAALWLLIASGIIFVYFVRHLFPVFLWAAVTAYLFNPVINYFAERTKSHRFVWIVALYVMLWVLILWGIRAIIPLVSKEVAELMSGAPDNPATIFGNIASQDNISIFGAKIDMRAQISAFASWFKDQFPSQLMPIFFGAIERTIFFIIYFVVTFYLLLDSSKFAESFERLVPEPYRAEISDLIGRINFTLGAYIRNLVVLFIIMSSASYVMLSVLQVKFALILSLSTAILELFPLIGPIIAAAGAVVVALLQGHVAFGLTNLGLAAIVAAGYFSLRQLEDYFVIPNLASRFVSVHPVLGIFALLVGASTGTALGIFLAIPAAAVLKVGLGYLYGKLTEE